MKMVMGWTWGTLILIKRAINFKLNLLKVKHTYLLKGIKMSYFFILFLMRNFQDKTREKCT